MTGGIEGAQDQQSNKEPGRPTAPREELKNALCRGRLGPEIALVTAAGANENATTNLIRGRAAPLRAFGRYNYPA